MNVLTPGHIYEIHNVDSPTNSTQRIEFVQRRSDDAKLLEVYKEGILAQELLRVLIDRTLYLNAEAPCIEDIEIVEMLRTCLQKYETRAARRSIEKLSMPEMQDVCSRCHHMLCFCNDPEKLEHGIVRS
jgi:hypothetical protein